MQCFLSQNHTISYGFNRTDELSREYQYGSTVSTITHFVTSLSWQH